MLKTLTKDPVILYFYPFGSTKYENLEQYHCNGDGTGLVLLCYDQEPITDYVRDTFDKIRDHFKHPRPIVLLNTEKNSQTKKILDNYRFIDSYYFFHIFAAADWYRGYQFCADLIEPKKRKISKKYITFNRITGNSRAYRSIFVSELVKNNLLEYGHVSYSDNCPEHGHYTSSILDLIKKHNVSEDLINETISYLNQIEFPLRVDHKDSAQIPNGSQTIDAISELMESFLYVVTETCFWESKEHLTEKIFRPIVTRHPFVLIGCANNLAYLKRYGFKTFDRWWDESYDTIEDPIERIKAVVKIIHSICQMSTEDLQKMLNGMQHILDYNYNLFYSKEFIDRAWDELTTNLRDAIPQHLLLSLEEI